MAVAAVLVIVCWIAVRDRRPASPLGALALQRSNAIEQQQMPFVPAKRALANSTSEPQTALDLKDDGKNAAGTVSKWVRTGNTELDTAAGAGQEQLSPLHLRGRDGALFHAKTSSCASAASGWQHRAAADH